MLDDILERLNGLPPEEVAKIKAEVIRSTGAWVPNPGPQTEAYLSQADLLLYGGQGGGGKTDYLAGTALTQHKRSLLVRRQYTDTGALIERTLQLNGTRKGFNGQPPASLRTTDGRLIEFGAAGSLDQVQTWQGQPHDFRGIDEACQLLEAVVRFLLGWVRDAVTDLGVASTQRCRAVLASNPPLSAEGEWVIGMFRPWLDLTHHNPAKHGELRFFVTDPDGKDMEVSGADDIKEWDGKRYIPQSRTFIPAALGDNPFLIDTGYQATLDAMPEPMRSAIRDGNFMASREDDEWQVIPTAWVRAAQARWTAKAPANVPMCAMGVDASGGGRDPMVIAPRHDGWFAPIEEFPGKDIPMERIGRHSAGLIVSRRRDGAVVVVDMGGGYGGSIFECLTENNVHVIAYKGSAGSAARTKDRQFGFQNFRSQSIWRFREALDPDQEGGSPIMLPADPLLTADLTAPRYEIRGTKICVETKEDVCKRLGRSTDHGDGVVMSWSAGPVMATHYREWNTRKAKPTVITKRSLRQR